MEEDERKRDQSNVSKTPKQNGHHVEPSHQEEQGKQQREGGEGANPAASPESDSSGTKKSFQKGGGAASAGGGLANLARQLTLKKSKGKEETTVDDKGGSNGAVAHDDLPLGSEATSLPCHNVGETRETKANGRPDPRLMLGWHSFNSDVSNQTTASSASLEMLLSTRQVDPEMMLRNLGFGGGMQTMFPSLERVPERFLNHPSQAYGIEVPGLEEPGAGDDAAPNDCSGGAHVQGQADGSTSSGGIGGRANGAASLSTSRRKPKTGIWTVARTLSMFGNLNRHQQQQQQHASPVTGAPPGSVLNVPNQIYLASRGFYQQYDRNEKTEKGKSAGNLMSKFKPENIQEEEEGEKQTSGRSHSSAISKRKMFQKSKSKTTWSLCDDSGDEGPGGVGGGGSGRDKKYSTTSNNSDWMTKSMDDSLSREDSTGVDDSSSKFAYFSTTTESSTDSIDRNSDTEKAFEEIRQQYKDGQLGLLPKKERSSSEDLFLPRRSSKSRDDDLDEGDGNDVIGGDRSVRFGDLSDDDGVADSRGDGGINRNVFHRDDVDLLRASLDSHNSGHGGRYFISPANSRQGTVEKAPSVVDNSYQPNASRGYLNNDQNDNERVKLDENNSNDNNNNKNVEIAEEFVSKESSSSLHSSVRTQNGSDGSRTVPSSSGNSDVRIVVSNSTEIISDTAPPTSGSSRLGVIDGIQRASSDSGSSSSGTAVGSASVITMPTDDLDTLRLSESENSITDRDSISRMNSPSGFIQPWGHAQGHSSSNQFVSCGVQTSSEDFDMVEELMQASCTKGVSASSGNVGPNTLGERSSNGFQLSSLPAGINQVQLMRRLHHSQDELPRMSSLQSDSSGFGDGEPGLDSGLQEGASGSVDNLVKVANLGSSSESNGTIASSVTTAILSSPRRKGETATQTSIDVESQSETPSNQIELNEANDHMTNDSKKPATYISHCIILHQATTKATKDSPTSHQKSPRDNDPSQPTHNEGQQSKHKLSSHSSPLSPNQDPSLNDYYYYQHQFCDDDNVEENHHLSSPSGNHPGLTVNGRRIRSNRHYSSPRNQIPPGAGSQFQPFFNFDPAPRGYAPSNPFQDHHSHQPDHHRLHHSRHHYQHYSTDPLDFYNLDDSDSRRRHHHHHHHRHKNHSKLRDDFMEAYDDYGDDDYNRDIDLLYREQSKHKERNRSRNQTPLSEELTEASSYSLGYSSAPPNGHLSSPSSLLTSPGIAASTSTPISPPDRRDDNGQSNRIISSVNVMITADGSHQASTTTTTASTPKLPSAMKKTMSHSSDASPHPPSHPTLAGNLTGVRAKDNNVIYANKKPPIFPSRKFPKQKSCDILDDDDDDAIDVDADDDQRVTSNHPSYQDPSPRQRYFNDSNDIDKNTSISSNSSLKPPPVMPMTFSPRDTQPHSWSSLQNLQSGKRLYPSSTPPLSRTWDDLEGGYSSMGDTSSEFSIRSMPVGAVGLNSKSKGVLDSQKLALLVNRPSSLKSTRRKPNSYQPRRSFREWNVLSRRKRLMEEDNLLQHSVHKYKTEMSLMQSAFLNEFGKAFHEMSAEEREEVQEVEWLWEEVKGQIAEMEDLISTRVQSVHSGNDFHSLLSSLGVIDKTIELLKEQIYQQQVSNQHGGSFDNLDDFDDLEDDISSRESVPSSVHSMMEGFNPWRGSSSRSRWRMTNQRRLQGSHSTSNLPSDINLSLDEMKSSLLREMRDEIKASTKKLEDSLTKKEIEIQELRKKLAATSASKAPALPSKPAVGQIPSHSSSSSTTSSKKAIPSTKVQRRPQAWIARSRSRVVGDRVVRETDI